MFKLNDEGFTQSFCLIYMECVNDFHMTDYFFKRVLAVCYFFMLSSHTKTNYAWHLFWNYYQLTVSKTFWKVISFHRHQYYTSFWKAAQKIIEFWRACKNKTAPKDVGKIPVMLCLC